MSSLNFWRSSLVASCLAAAVSSSVGQTWTSAPSLNHPRAFTASVVDPFGNIIVLGGMERVPGGQVILPSIEQLTWDGQAYATNWTTWSGGLPIERYFHSAVVTGGSMYVIGGARWGASTTYAEPILRIDRFDFLTQTWELGAIPDLPYGSLRHASVVDELGRIWVIGGGVPNAPAARAAVIMYDPTRPALGWQTKPSLGTARLFAGGVADRKGRIWTIGGLADGYSAHLSSSEMISTFGASWSNVPATIPGPVSNSLQAAMGADGFIYISGGWIGGYSHEVLRLNPDDAAGGWEFRAPLALARNEHTMLLGRDGYLYAIGGEAGSVQSQTHVERYNTNSCAGDLNGDHRVDLSDLAILLAAFGSVCG